MDEFSTVEVILVDNEDLVRRGFCQALGEAPDISVIVDTRVGEVALRTVELRRPQVVLVDAEYEFIQELARPARAPAAGITPGIIVLTSIGLDSHLFGSLKAGASGFLLKSASQEELTSAVRAVARGAAFICPTMTRRLIDRFEHPPAAARALSRGRSGCPERPGEASPVGYCHGQVQPGDRPGSACVARHREVPRRRASSPNSSCRTGCTRR